MICISSANTCIQLLTGNSRISMTPKSMTTKFSLTKIPLLPLLSALAIAIGFAVGLQYFSFTQDDAFITFRYAANFESGHGLVWNIGERVEGYTNSLWLMLLITLKALGLTYTFSAKFLGVLSSLTLLGVTIKLGVNTEPKSKTFIVGLSAAALVAFSYPLLYWTLAGLETTMFAALTLLSFLAWHKRSWLLALLLALATLTRPEGALLAGFFPLFALLQSRKLPRFELSQLGLALGLSLPFVFFKIYYYGGILPNPFYAKTGWDMQQLIQGGQYLLTFLNGNALFGIAYILPAFFYKKLPETARALYIFALLYTAYVVIVGGDVLRIGRFLVPVLAPLYLAFALSLRALFSNQLITLSVVALTLALNLWLPFNRAKQQLAQEQGFERANAKLITQLLANDSTNFSLATSTIGKVGFMLMGHPVYDMVGLTDTTVSRHPQEPIDGLVTSWRERKYNAGYILERSPDYILFSTSIKPSSPGERALMLYPEFLQNYSTIGFFFGGRFNDIFRKHTDYSGEVKRTIDVRFVQEYVQGIESWSARDYKGALKHFEKSIRFGPTPHYAYDYHFIGECLVALGKYEPAFKAYEQAIKLDSTIYISHIQLYGGLLGKRGFEKQTKLHRSYLRRLVPWAMNDIERLSRGN